MSSKQKHTLEAAARFTGSTKSRFTNLLKNNPDVAIHKLSELSKKQARQFFDINRHLENDKLPWNIAILIDSTIQNRSSLHTENSKRFNHGKGFVVGHQWTNIVLLINDKIIPLPPIPFYTKAYCKKYNLEYLTENKRVVDYLLKLSLKDYIGPHCPEKVLVLADSGYDDHKIKKAIETKKWKFIIALKSSRSVKTENAYRKTKKSEGWASVALTFKNNRRVGWKTIRVPKKNGKQKRMEFRIRQITGYIRNFGKAQLICSEYKKKSKGPRKYLASNDLNAKPRQIIIGYRLRWLIEIFHKEIKMFLGFEDASAKWFSSIVSHVHWVYCAYILMNAGPPGIPKGVSSMAEKQILLNNVIKNKQLSRINQLLTQINGIKKLKVEIRQALDGYACKNQYIFQELKIG